MSKSTQKTKSVVFWIFLALLFGVSALMNSVSGILYSRTASLSVLGFASLLLLLKCIYQKQFNKFSRGCLIEVVTFFFFVVLFFTSSIIPQQRVKRIIQEAGLDLPSQIKVHYFQEIIGFVGSEDSYNVTVSFPKKTILTFTKPFWPSENVTNKIVFDEARDGLPFTVFPNDIGPETFKGFINNLEEIDPNEFYEMRGKVNSSFKLLPFEDERFNPTGYFFGKNYNPKHKHWTSKNHGMNYIELFLDLEKKDTATAYMYLVIY